MVRDQSVALANPHVLHANQRQLRPLRARVAQPKLLAPSQQEVQVVMIVVMQRRLGLSRVAQPHIELVGHELVAELREFVVRSAGHDTFQTVTAQVFIAPQFIRLNLLRGGVDLFSRRVVELGNEVASTALCAVVHRLTAEAAASTLERNFTSRR